MAENVGDSLGKEMRVCDGWVYPARHVPSPNWGARPEADDIDLLVIHNISLPPGEFGGGFIEAFFQNSLNHQIHPYFEAISDLRVSAHLLIDRLGTVTQFVSLDERAWHAGESHFAGRDNCNDFSIGIELEGSDFTDFSEYQYAALVEVSRALMQRYPRIHCGRIVGHSDIAPGRKTDPGPCFDWERYLRALEQSAKG